MCDGLLFKAAFTAFTVHCIDFPSAEYLEIAVVAMKVLEAHPKLKELLGMAPSPTLHREKPVVKALEYRINECIRMYEEACERRTFSRRRAGRHPYRG